MGLSPARLAEMRACVSCSLYRHRTQVVLPVGPSPARWMALGEAPGAKENDAGLPFVHVAGDWLDRMFVSLTVPRAETFLVNSARCRPPQNRTPLPDEVATCLGRWFRDELEAVRPEVLFLLGSVPSLALLGARIKDTRGRLWTAPGIGAVIYPLFHPAAHAWNPGTGENDPIPLTRSDLARFAAWKVEVEVGRTTWAKLAERFDGAPGLRPQAEEQ